MTLNEHVTVNTELSQYAYRFYPDEGYVLWRDDELENLDENGQPYCYWRSIDVPVRACEELAPHIFAKLIDDTMEIFGSGNQTEVMSEGNGIPKKRIY